MSLVIGFDAESISGGRGEWLLNIWLSAFGLTAESGIGSAEIPRSTAGNLKFCCSTPGDFRAADSAPVVTERFETDLLGRVGIEDPSLCSVIIGGDSMPARGEGCALDCPDTEPANSSAMTLQLFSCMYQ
jgi:hypothetical protein